MIRFVHLTRASMERAIVRGGVRGQKALVDRREVAKAVFAMPMLPDFAVTHQWVRELRRWHGERMVAVHFRVPDDEEVLVGPYGGPPEKMPANRAARRVREAPMGAEVLVLRSIGKGEVVDVRPVPQLVGWVETPDPKRRFDCVCPACLPRGVPDRVRRLRAAYMHALDRVRGARTVGEKLDAMQRLDMPLEGARGRLDVEPIARLARSRDAEVRARAAHLLGYFPFRAGGDPLVDLLADRERSVRLAAARALVACAGPVRAAALARHGDEDLGVAVAEELRLRLPSPAVTSALESLARSPSSFVRAAVARSAETLLADEPDEPSLGSRLAAISAPRA